MGLRPKPELPRRQRLDHQGGADPQGQAAERRAAEGVEWLAALAQLATGGEDGRSANPHLVTLLRIAPDLRVHPAFECVTRRLASDSRDRLIKEVVFAAHGAAERGPLADCLEDLSRSAEEIVGAGPFRHIQESRAEAQRRAMSLAGELDPVDALAEVTGERLRLRVAMTASVFLPPPQSGRHGALLQRGGEWLAHLCFGFPLRRDPRELGITQPWLLGGAWHYAIEAYLRPAWPGIARGILAQSEVVEALRRTPGGSRGEGDHALTDFLRAHLNVALKCLLSKRCGVPDGVHRAFAQARGLVLFPWFEDWLADDAAGGGGFARHLASLPEALARDRQRWEALADAADQAPPAINLALLAAKGRGARMVLPDHWPAAAVQAWRLLDLPLLRYDEWQRRQDDPTPVVAFGEPGSNPLVRRVLEQRGLSLDQVEAAEPAIIALSTPGLDGAQWCVAVAVRDPAAAGRLRVETALRETSSHLVLDGGVVIRSQPVSLLRRGPGSHDSAPARHFTRSSARSTSEVASTSVEEVSQPERSACV